MRNLLLVATLALMTAGCGVLYRQPIYQGNLLEKSAVEQLQPGMSKQQVSALIGSPSIADPFNHDRWDYTTTQRTDRVGPPEVKNFTVWFENDAVTRSDGEYFPEQDEELVKLAPRQFGPNLKRDDKKKKGR